jgi:hypothetical protein
MMLGFSPGLLRCLLLHFEHSSAHEADLAVTIPVDLFIAIRIAYMQLSAAAALKGVAKKVPDTALGSALVDYAPASLKLSFLLVVGNINIHSAFDATNETELKLFGF